MKDKIINWIIDYCKEKNFKLIVGISGGIDSALVSTLCAMTNLETIVISMPIHQSESELIRAKNHINWLKQNFTNVIDKEYDLTNLFEHFRRNFNNEFNNDLAFANTRSRLRMITLYQIATSTNGIVVGTGNKVEDFGVGFFTKYGDGGVDISPIADLNKTEVRKLARELNIIEEILEANPTDGLWSDNRTDEQQIGASYEELEWAMNNINNKINFEQHKYTNRQKEILEIYNYFHSKNLHKMISIPICKIN